MKPISRGSGRSAVAASAYRSGTKLTNERDGLTHDFTRKRGIEYSEIVLPEVPDAGPDISWALDRSALWNAAELAENRKDARVAREFEVALPHELSDEQRVVLTREFAQELANRHGAAVDFAIHSPSRTSGAAQTVGTTSTAGAPQTLGASNDAGAGSATAAAGVLNYHAHIMMTTRKVMADGLGDKTSIERENKWLLNHEMPTSHMQLKQIRQSWEQYSNEHLARAGFDIRIDHRSHQDRGLEIEPTQHMGVQATQMDRRGVSVTRQRQEADAARRNAEIIREKPEQVLALITGEKSVFDRHDVARTLHRYIDDVDGFQNAFAKVMASDHIVELQAENSNGSGGGELARYSTREMVDIEHGMAASALRLGEARGFKVNQKHIARALSRHDDAIRRAVSSDVAGQVKSGELGVDEGDRIIGAAGLSDEQRGAVEHITESSNISVVVGYAGAGKSTMLAAAHEAWSAQGYRVHGAALSGKAAEGLEESSGIVSRTLASWEYGWKAGKGQLDDRNVFVIDEAGMVGSRQLAGFIGEAEKRGAKIVLVGDDEQLQAIGAGAPFRAIAERVGSVDLKEIRRQRVDWQKEASVAFASHRTGEGLEVYGCHGAIRFSETQDDARKEIVQDYLSDWDTRPEGSRIALAHRRVDVRAINSDIRVARQERGELAQGEGAGEVVYQTNDGQRSFAPGDRIVFLENNKDLGVKNGMLGTVEDVGEGQIKARLDGRDESLIVPTDRYQAIDHGYATTIHKSQGATVDRAFVMASSTMDRHLTYVSMTRHRDDVRLYASREEFAGKQFGERAGYQSEKQSGKLVGTLVEHGAAPYENDSKNKDSYFVTLKSESGGQKTVWGVDLERVMDEAVTEAGLNVGDRVGLARMGSEAVQLPSGQTVERNGWKVQTADEMALAHLKETLGRSGTKETTLDYVVDFAARRGLGEGLDDEIRIDRLQEVDRNLNRANEKEEVLDPYIADDVSAAGHVGKHASEQSGQSMFTGLKLGGSQQGKDQNKQNDVPDLPERTEVADAPKRGMFDGLQLSSKSKVEDLQSEEVSKGLGARLGERSKFGPEGKFERSLDRYARVYECAAKLEAEGLSIPIGQRQELQKAAEQLDGIQPGSVDLLVSALRYDPDAGKAMSELSGRERTSALVEAIDNERELQSNPIIRADRIIDEWRDLSTERGQLPSWGQKPERNRIESDMREVANQVRKDPEMEAVMRSRVDELGISHLGRDHKLDEVMVKQLSRGIER